MESYPLSDLSHSTCRCEANGMKTDTDFNTNDPFGDPIPTKNKSTWKSAWIEFTQTTTFHGLRYIWLDHSFPIRRICWFLLVLGCGGLLAFQLVDRIIYYYSWPVTVNVHVNFNKTMLFPSVTLCNQNAFRSTAATKLNRYELIDQMFTSSNNFSTQALEYYNSTNITLDDFFQQTAHTKEDLIIRCEWQNEQCGPDNFTEIFTDHGVCYSFNHQSHNALAVTSTGSDYGLKLTLNVEQYEYMPGPHTAAGIKLLFHDQKEFPKVHELGLAIPTGAHAFIGLQLVSIANLPKPHGDCAENKSPYYRRYSPDACRLTCMTQFMNEACGCRHHFMPSIEGEPPICTLQQYYGCFLQQIGQVKNKIHTECECPVPCHFLIFDPSLSFAATSTYATDRLLAATSGSNLQERYDDARETTSRMDQLKFKRFQKLEQDVSLQLQTLKHVMVDEIQATIQEQEELLTTVSNETGDVLYIKDFLYRYQQYMVVKNFARARDAMEERTFNFLALGFQEFSYQIETKISQLMDPEFQNFSTRQTLYIMTMNQLNGRIDLADRAFANYTDLYNSYATGNPIFRYQFETESRNDNIFVIPKPLLEYSLNHSAYAETYSKRVGNDVLLFKSKLQNLSAILEEAYHNKTLNETQLHEACVLFLHSGRRYFHSKSTFYFETIDYPKRIITERISNLSVLSRQYKAVVNSMKQHLSSLKKSLEELKASLIKQLEHGLESASDFIIYGNITKMSVAKEMTSSKIFNGISNLKMFFQDLRSRGQSVYDGWSSLADATAAVWNVAINDDDMLDYFNYKNMSLFLRNFTDVKFEIEQNYTRYRILHDLLAPVGNIESLFLKSLEDLMYELQMFMDEAKIDSNFIKENFLQLDIFYREKSYEEITQQIAYDNFALFCDFGGSMGLFVGASVLTVFELLDLIIQQCLKTAK
ncbi:uncharacterized protein LOC126828236 isoform X1 [Patella vulgata]|uniref:uncharacterized protein LOC126828236 isoform X1 n=2 Tax=Patella vulgata TaxID=6465 RepID=UPI00218050B1|nr:uncharacterized protein LOC126828236 isoform X1 [Patella vulgata]